MTLTAALYAILAGLAAVVGLVWRAWAAGKRQATTETALQAAERHAKAAEAGRKTAAKAKVDLAKDMTPEEIVRRNDGQWND